jgi:hypothetical protein
MLAVATGMLVGARYRLWEQLGGQGESSIWGAADEALRRPVMVWVFPPGFQRTGAVAAAAQAAGRLHELRLARVFGADMHGELPYVVTEWPAGRHLGQLLTAGPADPVSAAAVVAEAASALAAAHAAWLAHLCLRPCSVWWSTKGAVQVSGLGIAAAAAGIQSDAPVLADVQGLGRVLYAALTGYWPGVEQTLLPPAPFRGDRLCRPSQVRSGIPGELDAVACRALAGVGSDAGPPIVDPVQLAYELTHATGACTLRHALARSPLPVVAVQPSAAPSLTQPLAGTPVADPDLRHREVSGTNGSPRPAVTPMPHARGRWRRAKITLAVMLMLALAVLLAAGGWYLVRHSTAARGPGSAATAAPIRPAHAGPPRSLSQQAAGRYHPL